VLLERGGDWGIGTHLALGGDSAGGNLTLAACLALRDRRQTRLVRGMLLNYSVFDFECSAWARTTYGGPGYMLGADEMDAFWRNYLRDDADTRNPLACPALAELGGLPPAMLVIPECDLLTEQNLVMADRLRAAGVATAAHVYSGASHSFLEAMSIADVSRRALDDSAHWLREILRGEATDPS
jgi:acetyl esterase